MAQLVINVADAVVNRALNAASNAWGYQAGPETRTQFVRRRLAEYLKSVVIRYESETAGQSASVTQEAASKVEIDIS